MKTILMDTTIHPDAMKLLQQSNVNVLQMFEDTPERRKELADAHALIIASVWQIDDVVLAQAPKLQVVGRPGIGIDNIDLDAATRHHVCVVHTPDAPTQSTAEHAFTLLMACAKNLAVSDRTFREHGWKSRNSYGVGVELKGKTLGLVGLGRIGGAVARMARDGFGMRVLVFDPYINATRALELNCERRETLHEMLAESDFVSVHCALSPQTRGLIGQAELEAMKTSAFLINCARGPIVDEAALVEALKIKRIAGAGLDVFAVEPTPHENPLLKLDNVIVTPHIASRTEDGVYQMGIGVVQEVCAALEGRKPRWLANPLVWDQRRQ